MPFITTCPCDKCRLWWHAFDFYRGYVSGKARLPSSGSEYKLLNTFEFIKAAYDTVLGMINAAYYDKPFIFIWATFREKLVSHHHAVSEVDSCLLMRSVGSKAAKFQQNRSSLVVVLILRSKTFKRCNSLVVTRYQRRCSYLRCGQTGCWPNVLVLSISLPSSSTHQQRFSSGQHCIGSKDPFWWHLWRNSSLPGKSRLSSLLLPKTLLRRTRHSGIGAMKGENHIRELLDFINDFLVLNYFD